MNKIFKTKNDRSSQSLEDRLKSYAKEKIQQPMNNALLLSKGTLAILTPLAAASLVSTDINAQCAAGTFDPSGGYYGDGQLDVNGDGIADFDFDVYNFDVYSGSYGNYIFITPVGSLSVGASDYAAAVTCGNTLSGGNSYTDNGFWSFSYYLPGSGATLAIPIQNAAGNLGFIEITFNIGGGYSINLAGTGIATSPGAVTACECSTLAPLPISLTNFEVKTKSNEMLLSWSTESELENRGFEIQRSADGENFYKIGWIDGAGTNNSRLDYDYTDKDVRSNVLYYYRLKQTDLSGKFTYSSVLDAKIKSDQHIKLAAVYPNPVKSAAINLEVESNSNYELSYELLNSTGQKVLGKIQTISEGINNITISTTILSAGTYFLKVDAQDFSEYKKIIIEK